jgi:hypothetical protein
MSSKNKSLSKSQSKKLCARKFCKNNITRRVKKNFPTACKVLATMLKGIGSKKSINMKKCMKDMEKKVQEMCVKTSCNPSCQNVPNLDAKDIQDGFNKNMSVSMKKALKSVGAESGCYNNEKMEKLMVTLKAAIPKNKKK